MSKYTVDLSKTERAFFVVGQDDPDSDIIWHVEDAPTDPSVAQERFDALWNEAQDAFGVVTSLHAISHANAAGIARRDRVLDLHSHYMRTRNGGIPERITVDAALREILRAQTQVTHRGQAQSQGLVDGEPIEVTGINQHVRIDYRDVRGTVELRPATKAETDMDIKPEDERYAPGDHVLVRSTFYLHEDRRTYVLDEYEGTVVNWCAGHYKVRAVHAGEHGEGGVRQCRVDELRPVPPAAEDVVDVPHALYVNGERRREDVSAEQIRRIVGNLRFKRVAFRQDPADHAIVVENRRYVPQSPATNSVEIREGVTYEMYRGHVLDTATLMGTGVTADDVRKAIAIGIRRHATVCNADGTIQVGGTWFVPEGGSQR